MDYLLHFLYKVVCMYSYCCFLCCSFLFQFIVCMLLIMVAFHTVVGFRCCFQFCDSSLLLKGLHLPLVAGRGASPVDLCLVLLQDIQNQLKYYQNFKNRSIFSYVTFLLFSCYYSYNRLF